MKKLLLIVMVLALVMTSFTGCGKSGEATDNKAQENDNATTSDTKVNKDKEGNEVEEIILNMAVVLRDAELSPADVEIYQELEEKTGVKINWSTSPEAGWEEKRSLLFASDDLPDVFFGNTILTDDDVLKYGAQGMIIPIESYITEEIMPNLSRILANNPEYRKGITASDGHIYSLPNINAGITTTTLQPLYINADWLEAVNMEVPTTMEEFYLVLKAFKENDVNGNGDPDDEIPYSFHKSTNYASDLFGSFGIIDDTKSHIDLVDGKVVFTAASPEYKEAIMFFNKMFNDGLIDQEVFTHDSKAFSAKLKAEVRKVGVFQAWRSTSWALETGDDSYVPVATMTGPNGDRLWPLNINGIAGRGAFAVTHKATDPEYIMKWADNLLDPVFMVQAASSLRIGLHIADTNGDGKYETIAEANRENRTGIVPQGRERLSILTDEATDLLADIPKHMIEKQMLDTYYEGTYKMEYYPKVYFTLDEISRLAILKTDIIGYADEMYAKWIQVGGIEEEWDGYIKKMKEMGMDEMVQIHQDAYDRYSSN